MNKTFIKSALGMTMAMMISHTASATETIKAVAIDGYPAKAMWVKEFSGFFIPEVDKRLAETGNYKMDWQESYSQTQRCSGRNKTGSGRHRHCHHHFSLLQTSQSGIGSGDPFCRRRLSRCR